MQDDPNHGIDARQAAIAERLEVEPDPETPTVRHVVLDGRRVGKVVYLGDEDWAVFHRIAGSYRDARHWLTGTLEDIEDADRLAVGEVADAIARGTIRLDGEGR